MNGQQLDCALDLMRRLPPQNIEKNLSDLIDLVPDLCEDLLASVDQPLKIAKDRKSNKDYLLCDYNRDGDSYRSPWSNEYDPPIEDGSIPSDKIRKFEMEANCAFDVYREQYFEGGISSCYFWDQDNGGFAGAILIKKTGDGAGCQGKTLHFKGSWDSIHVVEVQEKGAGRNAHYKLISTVMLWLHNSDLGGSNSFDLGGSLSRQAEKDAAVTDMSSHIVNIGQMIEKMENSIRGTLDTIYFGRTRDIMNETRSMVDLKNKDKMAKVNEQLAKALIAKQQK